MKSAFLISIALFAILLQLNEVNAETRSTSYTWRDFQVAGSYIYGIDFNNRELEVLGTSYPNYPTRIGYCSLSYYPFRISVSGNYAYILQTTYGQQYSPAIDINYSYAYITVVDISYPYSPSVVWISGSALTNVHGIAASGNMLFVSTMYYLYLYDISSPRNPISRTYIPTSSPGEMVTKYIDYNNAILLFADRSTLYSYQIQRSSSYISYTQMYSTSYLSIRDVFISENIAYAVSESSVYKYLISSDGYLYSTYDGNNVLHNKANRIIHNNYTSHQFINYQSGNEILNFNEYDANYQCSYHPGQYQLDIMSSYSSYIYATQYNGGALVIIDLNAEACSGTRPLSPTAGIIVGIIFGVIFFIFLVACVICVFVRQYRKIRATSYRPLVNSPTVLRYTQQPYLFNQSQPIVQPNPTPIQPPHQGYQTVYQTQPPTTQPSSQGNPPPPPY